MSLPRILLISLASTLVGAVSAAEGLVLVAGATGQTGKLVVAALQERNIPVRAMTRSEETAASLRTRMDAVVADVTDPASLPAAMAGVDVVISTIGARFPIGSNGFAAVDWEGNRALIDAAKSAGVSQFVLLSAGSAGRDGFPYSWSIAPYPWKAKSEAHLRDSGLPYTIIAAGGLRDDPGGMVGVKLVPREDYESAQISRADLAEVIAACVRNPAVLGKTITVVNDEAFALDAWRGALAELPAD